MLAVVSYEALFCRVPRSAREASAIEIASAQDGVSWDAIAAGLPSPIDCQGPCCPATDMRGSFSTHEFVSQDAICDGAYRRVDRSSA